VYDVCCDCAILRAEIHDKDNDLRSAKNKIEDLQDRVKELTETLQECARLVGLMARHDRNTFTLKLLDLTSEFAE
jgi:hypothetical protein